MRVWLVAALVAGLSGESRADEGAVRPNVVLICIDDLNDWVGPLGGHSQVRTPGLDRLAERGVTFANAHCQAPLCNPSRTSFLTGLRPGTTGVYALEPPVRSVPGFEQVVTLPQHFQANGYRTLIAGKVFHDGQPAAKDRRNGNEVDEWGPAGSHAQPRPERPFVSTPGGHPLVDWGAFPDREEAMSDTQVADWAVSRLKALADDGPDRPFWMGVGFRRPHVPCYAPQKWFDLYPDDGSLVLAPFQANDRDDTPRASWWLHWRLPEPRRAWLESAGQTRALTRAYLACVSYVDAQVGRVLDAIDGAGLADRTIVVVLSDHGWHLGEKGITGKNSLWERSTRVPLIVAGPGVARGTVCRRPAELLDVYPTLVELAGLPRREGLEGHSLVPQLRDPSAARLWPAITVHGPGNVAVRDEAHRYIRYADGSEELYDLATDPNEWTNRADDPSVAGLKRSLAAWIPAHQAPPAPGSHSRLIDRRDGVSFWEGVPIGEGEGVPD
jgi:arylsulfatase A-like enzyme